LVGYPAAGFRSPAVSWAFPVKKKSFLVRNSWLKQFNFPVKKNLPISITISTAELVFNVVSWLSCGWIPFSSRLLGISGQKKFFLTRNHRVSKKLIELVLRGW